jgi:putative ABC transport system permease protein
MIKNYIKVAINNLLNNRTYSIISITSLSIGLAVCIVLLLYVQHELSYDNFHVNAKSIYRLCQTEHPYSAPPVGKLLTDKLPEVENYTRILPRDDMIIKYNDTRFKENGLAFTDAETFSLFTFNFIDGVPETALSKPGTIVITDKIAKKYFGDEDPMGKVLNIGNDYDCTVTGVIEDVPQNSHFRFNFFITLVDGDELFGKQWMSSWGWQNFLVYFQMQDDFNKDEVEAKICQLLKNPSDPEAPLPEYYLQNISDIHLYSAQFDNDIQPQNSIVYVLIFSAIGILILFIACFNYINLMSANATSRVTEIGVRKVFGASGKQMALRFVTESLLVITVSVIISALLLKILLPVFNDLSGKKLSFSSLINPEIIMGVLGIIILTVLLAVWYPVFVLPSFQVTNVIGGSSSKFRFRKFLVGFQFTIVIILTGCAIVMFRQISFMKNKELGFEKDYVLVSVVDDFGDEQKFNTLKQELLNQSNVLSVSQASRVPSYDLSDYGEVVLQGEKEQILIPYVHVNYDYFKTLGILPKQGRLFSSDIKSDIGEAIIVNQLAIEKIGITGNPIGQTLECNWPESNRKIIGVLEDFHFESLYEKIVPAVFVINPQQCWQLMIKVGPSNASTTISELTGICESSYPDQIFDFHFLDERINNSYLKEGRTFKLLQYFAVLAVFLACIGLFGMASFILVSRTKEIGIRKVNGASITEIVQLLNRNFVIWVTSAFVIATPIAWYVMNLWLQNFAYRTKLTWWIFALAGIFTLIIVLLTISWLSIKTARRNPVEALRYE